MGMYANLDPPADLYFLITLGVIFFIGSAIPITADLGVLPASYAAPLVPVLALFIVGALFLAGAAYVYRIRAKTGANPFRPDRD